MASEARPNTRRPNAPRPSTLRKRDGALVITRGKGAHVWDETGKEHIEGMAGL